VGKQSHAKGAYLYSKREMLEEHTPLEAPCWRRSAPHGADYMGVAKGAYFIAFPHSVHHNLDGGKNHRCSYPRPLNYLINPYIHIYII
jgi:hypothetical protein